MRLEGCWPSAHISQTPQKSPAGQTLVANTGGKHWCAKVFGFTRINPVLNGARNSPANQTDARRFWVQWCNRCSACVCRGWSEDGLDITNFHYTPYFVHLFTFQSFAYQTLTVTHNASQLFGLTQGCDHDNVFAVLCSAHFVSGRRTGAQNSIDFCIACLRVRTL